MTCIGIRSQVLSDVANKERSDENRVRSDRSWT